MTTSIQSDRPYVSNIAVEAVPDCPACGSSQRHWKFDVREHEYTTTTDDQFPLMECEGCGAWYLDPRPHTSALDIIYPPNYFLHVLEAKAGDNVQAARSGLFGKIQNRLVKARFAPVERHMPITPETRWLDIGCGTGLVLNSVREAYGVVGTGIDYSEHAVELCRKRGFEAHATRFEDYSPGPDEAYDLVHSSHLIEHVASPYEYMQKCYELTRPGGINVFLTPNIDTWEAHRFGRFWGGLHVPRHWTLLNSESSKKLGERAGFEHLGTHFSTNGVFWAWSFHAWMVERFSRERADRFFPSDHKLMESSLLNVVRTGVLSAFDALNVLIRRQSSNMLVIFRRPAGS